ncbi:hypothetical protein T02_4438 [Trichinella nativa]|uniref:Uncharacterized protein n=1 Tax=Trichinella nativa TaxID=6335 RepID=A0A0V1LNX9_9BILA|nr:hypothetical protein T06_5110 [Trichinella sp. T6]KRZ61185.1 hypothetical protein T02_4438 [Trichinella nativa]
MDDSSRQFDKVMIANSFIGIGSVRGIVLGKCLHTGGQASVTNRPAPNSVTSIVSSAVRSHLKQISLSTSGRVELVTSPEPD